LPNFVNGNTILNAFDTFNISSLPQNIAGKTAQVIVFLRGISRSDTTVVTHNGTIKINGTSFDVSFTEYNDYRDTFSIPLSLLQNGANTFEVDYKQGSPANLPDKWYFDYYSISLPEGLSPNTDTAIAKGQWDFTLQNFQ